MPDLTANEFDHMNGGFLVPGEGNRSKWFPPFDECVNRNFSNWPPNVSMDSVKKLQEAFRMDDCRLQDTPTRAF
jgi:hypothetical protein